MTAEKRKTLVSFTDQKTKAAFEGLSKGKTEEKELFSFIERAIEDLSKNPLCGVRIPSKLWPKEYLQNFKIDNLRKYDLPNGWRLIYTLRGNEVEIISVIIEWFDHKNYERKFNY